MFLYFLGIPSITAFDKSGLKIVFNFDKPPDNPEMIIINLYATNYSYEPIYDFLFQAAVPKVIYFFLNFIFLFLSWEYDWWRVFV